MLISEKMRQQKFSSAESEVVSLMLNRPEIIEECTIKEIAESCYVHPSTLIRVAKKLGFTGWTELKDAFTSEQKYLHHTFDSVDANLPFTATDGIMTVAAKLAALEKATIEDSLSLLTHDELMTAKKLLLQAKQIKVFASNANALIARDFALKMQRIRKNVQVADIFGEAAYEAYNCTSDTCGILISYTGENKLLCQTGEILKKQGASIIAITSIGDNSLAALSTVALRMTTRERLYSKIGNFVSNTSICYLLDVLYGCCFADEYQQNLAHLITIGKQVDTRTISSAVMQEEQPWQLQDSFLPN